MNDESSILDRHPRRRGSAIVEFAVMIPMTMLFVLGAADFARIFYHAIVLSNSAAMGSFFGSQSNVDTGRFAEIEARAGQNADDLNQPSTATASRRCECPPDEGDEGFPEEVNCLTAVCPDYGVPRVYIRTQVQQTFSPLVPWPGIPQTITLTRNVWMRSQ